jgi:hypothetical protein
MTSPDTTTKKSSKAWYLLPIFVGIIGGLIMYFVLKDQNKKMAKNGLILGIILTVAGFAISIASIAMAAMMG